jgi:hypothetical protein
MGTGRMRRVHRYSNEFKITAIKLASLPGTLIQDVAMVLIALIPLGAAFVILLWTGEILRYIFSFGRRKLRRGISAFPKSGWHSGLISQLKHVSWYRFLAADVCLIEKPVKSVSSG